MSSFLCFICHSTVNAEISEETREKYREIVGMNLCPDSQLCHICCHVLNKLSLFRSICLKRSLEYPVLFSEKGTIYLQKTNIEILGIPCLDDSCNQYQSSTKTFQFSYNSHDSYSPNNNCGADNQNQYVALEDDNHFKSYFNPVETDYQIEADDIQNAITDADELIRKQKNDENEKLLEDGYIDEYDNFCYRDELQNCFNDKTVGDDNKDVSESNSNDEYGVIENDNQMNHSDANSEDFNDVNNESVAIDESESIAKQERKGNNKRKKGLSKKVMLSVEEQKAVLEAQRKEKKYLDAEFKCYNCALPFLFKDTYQAHMMRHEESNGEYLCPICTLRFASPAGLRAHAQIHARRGVPEPRPAHRATCHLCGHLLKDANGLQQHLRRVHRSKGNRLHSCTVCGESFPSQPALRTHMIKHIRRSFTCTECPATYSSPYTLAQHRKKHFMVPERHRCDMCGNDYSSRKSLLAHRRTAAAHQQSVLECPICSRVCPNQRSLTLHVQAIHSNTKDHACPHCTARYSTRRSLLRHAASHARRPPPSVAVCHLCGNSFKGKSKLNRHLRNVCEKSKLQEQLDSIYE